MTLALLVLSIISIGLFVILLFQQRRISTLSPLEGKSDAHDARLQGKEELLRQKDVMLAKLETIIEQKNSELLNKDKLLGDALQKADSLRKELSDSKADAASLKSELTALHERISVTDSEREKNEKLTAEHLRNLANEIFEAQTRRFKESSEIRLEEILSPLKSNIADFKKAVNDAYSNEARERYSLQNEIRNLIDLNRTIGKEAQDLVRALKGDSKIQGDWGEMILERLLEMSGLQKGYHFVTQATTNPDGTKITDAGGNLLKPDVVVNYPDGRCVVIDSKVSLNAYIDYANAGSDKEAAGNAAKRHITSVKNHINELAVKQYQDIVGDKRLDFVMMFIPNEGAYFAMMHIEPNLWEDAYKRRVLITSPTHLISILKMLEQLWKQDAINKNVQEIARLSGTMIDKLVNFTADLDDIDKHLNLAQNSYKQARKRLVDGQGNVMVTAQKIVKLGAKPKKANELSAIVADDDIIADAANNSPAITE